MSDATALERLSIQVAQDLDYIKYPIEKWVVPLKHPTGERVYDVAIVGGGQSGMAIAFALLKDRVDNIVVYDRRPRGFEGPWNTTARMLTLRTPKHLPGVDLGIPSLTPRAWFSAKYSSAAWDALDKISKQDWQEYLLWCRDTLNLPIRNQVDVTSIVPDGDVFRVDIRDCSLASETGATRQVLARHVVLATGAEGSGDWDVPKFITEALPKQYYATTGDVFSFSKLKGKRVAVLGAGASAFDNASTALEHGAAQTILCIRRKQIQRINPQVWMAKAGFLRHFGDLSDDWKCRFMEYLFTMNIPAPQSAYDRFSKLPGAEIRSNAGWKSVRLVKGDKGDEVEITTEAGDRIRADFLIAAVGFKVDFGLRPELAGFSDKIAVWNDRVHLAKSVPAAVGTYPYLGPSFELQEKIPGTAPYLHKIRNFTYGAMVSMGLSGAALSGLRISVPRLVAGITRDLFVESAAAQFEGLTAHADLELVGPMDFRRTQIASA